jgi:DNA-binding transcriptional MerR regulator
MPYKARLTEKLYYSISEVAALFKVNASLIRFWEKEFDIIRPFRNKKGNRLFTKEDVDNFYLIYHLVKERGFTLQGAKDKLKENREDTINQTEIVKSLTRIRDFLQELKKNLDHKETDVLSGEEKPEEKP